MRICEQCGNEFDPKRADQRFCNRSCSAKWTARQRGQVGIVAYVCAQCGREFRDYAGNHRAYCSKECEIDSHRKERPRCEVCGKPVRLMRNRYCSKTCSNLARERPGITSWSGFYQRAQAANPDPQPCAICGKPGEHRHHPDYRKPELVVWLCTGCHAKLHPNKRNGEHKRPAKIPLSK